MPWIPGGGNSLISGEATNYSTLPSPASSYTGQVWYVQEASGGLLSALGVYKYPKGLYSPNSSDVWELVPINVKVSEDSLTLVNIIDWAEFYAFAFDISDGDRLIYLEQTYVNLTGTQTSTAPDTDATNWAHADLFAKSLQLDVEAAGSYSEGKIYYDSVSKGHILDTGYADVRLNAGRERHLEVYNDTGTDIINGDPVSVTGQFTGNLPNVIPTDSSNILSALGFAGAATMDIPDGESGLVAVSGRVNEVNTQSLSVGFMYADSNGWYTQVRPLYPEQRILVGAVAKTGVTDGILYIASQNISRRNASRSFGFTSAGIGAGTYYKAGFYDWSTTSAALTQASLTQTYGTVDQAYAAHVGIVPSAAGVVDTGQVGLRVVGIEDNETGAQVAAQTGIITEDITTLTVDVMAECSEKFSGQVSIELYVVSGSPVNYSLTFNYGYSKYEDFSNQNITLTTIECVWQGNSLDTGFDIALIHHTATGWTYAASGFTPGNGDIARKSVDQALAGDVVNNEDGAWKRVGVDYFVAGSSSEGVIFEITTTQNNTIQTMDMHLAGFSEEL